MTKECVKCGHVIEEQGAIQCPKCDNGLFRVKSNYERSLDGVFISYSRKDHKKASALVNELSKRNIRVWIDDGEIRGGENFERRIHEGLEGSVRVIVLWSKASVKSDWVNREASFALRRG